mmetsp:Transcript_83285/g.131750  ORF Transcript_83285/g.131750 Transcript_83285/m.131750 type:complete len:180 (-) Transcript_83285:103-642(-)
MFACCSCTDGPSRFCLGEGEESTAEVVQKGDKERSFETVAPCHPFSAGEDDKEMAKQRLQRLIRDFAQEAVADGIPVQVIQREAEEELPVTLRLDRRLRQVEFWQGPGAAMIIMPLAEVESITKVDTEDMLRALVIASSSTEVRVHFESVMIRDRAYTCLRIFQMSVAHEPTTPSEAKA